MTGREERLNAVDPAWEPIPWDAPEETVESMYEGYAERSGRAINWRTVPLLDFPEEGLFDQDRQWFIDHEIAFFVSSEGEDLLLIDNIWFGWPDPPRWGLASRPSGRPDLTWRMWGHFPDLPPTWTLPKENAPHAQN